MKVDKMSISMDPQLGDDVQLAAERAGVSVSSWLAEAAADAVREALKQAGVAIEDLPQGVRWKLVE